MRLIDADGLKSNISGVDIPYYIKRDFIRMVDAMPTTEPERKTAEWVDAWRPKLDGTRYYYRQCSGCGFERDDCNPDKDTPHCPICGAKMCIGEKND